MTVLVAMGFDDGGPDAIVTASTPTPEGVVIAGTAGTITHDAAIAHGSVGKSLKLVLNASGAALNARSADTVTITTGRDYWATVWLYAPPGHLPGATAVLATLESTAGVSWVNIAVGSTGDVVGQADTSTITLGTLSGAFTVGAWHQVTFRIRHVDGTATDQAEAWFDGVQIGVTSVASFGAVTTLRVRAGYIVTALANASKQLHIDDGAINDNQGSVLNARPGDLRVNILLPSSDNARTGTVLWVGGAGGTTNLFDAVNNSPPVGVAIASDTDTSQIRHNGSGAGVYDANCPAYSTLTGLAAATDVKSLCILSQVGEEVTTGDKLVRLEGVSGPVIAATADQNVAAVSGAVATWALGWITIYGTRVETQPAAASTAPVIRINRAETASRACACCFLALQVVWIYTAPAPGGATRYRSIMMVGD